MIDDEIPFALPTEAWMYMSEEARQKLYGPKLAADETANALEGLLNAIRSPLCWVKIETVADETWANVIRRADKALEEYKKCTAA